jgi:hypothetical protein
MSTVQGGVLKFEMSSCQEPLGTAQWRPTPPSDGSSNRCLLEWHQDMYKKKQRNQ